MWRYMTIGAFLLIGGGPCLPNNYFADLFANTLSGVIGVVLSDFLNIVLPPVA